VSNNYRGRDELTEKELEIRDLADKELSQFEGFCSGALKTVFIKAWLADGTMEIKKV
jgi:hypothetical protein